MTFRQQDGQTDRHCGKRYYPKSRNRLCYGADVKSALNTGFVNGSAYANYTKGKRIWADTINLRDYDNRTVKIIL